MKRIDDKIKEIEKKDKTNRTLYIVVVVLLIVFMGYVFFTQGKIQDQDIVINKQGDTIKESRAQLVKTNEELQETIEKLEASQTPVGFWNETKDLGTTRAYLAYITYSRDTPNIDFREDAYEEVVGEDIAGITGWMYIGKADGNEMSQSITDVIWRNEAESENENWVPKENDILKLKGNAGRFTYSSFNRAKSKTGTKNTWNPNVKAIVLEKRMDGPTAVYLKVKY